MEYNKLDMKINGERLIARLKELGQTGINETGRSRIAASDEDKMGRDLVVGWMKEIGLRVEIDKIGNVFGIWETEKNKSEKAIMMGSHIDSVINAGMYDGCYGVLSGIEVIETLKENNVETKRPLIAAFFTNEEGVRYQPDMQGSLVYVGGMDVEEALAAVGIDGTILKDELVRTGYYGQFEPGHIMPAGYVELHVEQGPVLDHEGYQLGAVTGVQGINWQKLKIEGAQNHAGTTPTYLRKDAGLAAAKINTFLRERALATKDEPTQTVATVGSISFSPNLINVIPQTVEMTVDIRNANKEKWLEEDEALHEYLKVVEEEENVTITTERLAYFEPVPFDESIIGLVEEAAKSHELNYRRIVSGAGHDAQMLARVCPTAMIFAPSIEGISHNPGENTNEEDLHNGANVLLDVIYNMSEQ